MNLQLFEWLSGIEWKYVVGAVAIYFAGAFKNVTNQLFIKLYKVAVNKITEFFSGTKWFQNVDLTRYRRKLRNELPNIFQSPFDSKSMLIVELEASSSAELNHRRNAVTLILDSDQLLLYGAAGLGKSTTCRQVLERFCNDKWAKKMPVYVDLQKYALSEIPLADYIAKQLDDLGLPSANRILERKSKKKELVFLFDALDQVQHSSRSSIFKKIVDYSGLLPGAQLTVLGRPHAFRGIHQRQFLLERLQPLSDNSRQEIISSHFRGMRGVPLEDRLNRAIGENAVIRNFASNPLLLNILLQFYSERQTDYSLQNRLQLFGFAVSFLFGMWHEDINRYQKEQKELLLGSISRRMIHQYKTRQRRLSEAVKTRPPSGDKTGDKTGDGDWAVTERSGLRIRKSASKKESPRAIPVAYETQERMLKFEAFHWDKISFKDAVDISEETAKDLGIGERSVGGLLLQEIAERNGILNTIKIKQKNSAEKDCYTFRLQAFRDYFIAIAFFENIDELIGIFHNRLSEFSDVIRLSCSLLDDPSEAVRLLASKRSECCFAMCR